MVSSLYVAAEPPPPSTFLVVSRTSNPPPPLLAHFCLCIPSPRPGHRCREWFKVPSFYVFPATWPAQLPRPQRCSPSSLFPLPPSDTLSTTVPPSPLPPSFLAIWLDWLSREGSVVYYEIPGQISLAKLRENGLDMDALCRHYVYITEFLWKV